MANSLVNVIIRRCPHEVPRAPYPVLDGGLVFPAYVFDQINLDFFRHLLLTKIGASPTRDVVELHGPSCTDHITTWLPAEYRNQSRIIYAHITPHQHIPGRAIGQWVLPSSLTTPAASSSANPTLRKRSTGNNVQSSHKGGTPAPRPENARSNTASTSDRIQEPSNAQGTHGSSLSSNPKVSKIVADIDAMLQNENSENGNSSARRSINAVDVQNTSQDSVAHSQGMEPERRKAVATSSSLNQHEPSENALLMTDRSKGRWKIDGYPKKVHQGSLAGSQDSGFGLLVPGVRSRRGKQLTLDENGASSLGRLSSDVNTRDSIPAYAGSSQGPKTTMSQSDAGISGITQSNDSENKTFQHELPSSSMTVQYPGESGSRDLSAIMQDARGKKRKAVAPPNTMTMRETFDNSPTGDDVQRFRFGYREQGSKNAKIKFITVAYAVVDGSRKPDFYLVDTWIVNGMQFGHFQLAIEFDFIKDEIDRDTDFETFVHKNSLSKAMLAVVDGDLNALPAYGGPPGKKKKTEMRTEMLKPEKLPVEPHYANIEAPTNLKPTLAKGDVNSVIIFIDKTGYNIDLKPFLNIQCLNKPQETYEKFRTYVINGKAGSRYEGLRKPMFKHFGNNWDFEVWVMPQVKNKAMMYRWGDLTMSTNKGQLVGRGDRMAARESTVTDWLDADLTSEYGRCLYFEVHIYLKDEEREGVDDADEGGKSKGAKAKKGTK